MPEECKICLVSYLPMESAISGGKPDGLIGLLGNDYDITNWRDFYQLSMKKTEKQLESTKDKWFEGAYERWQNANDGVLEGAHLDVELKCQHQDPKALSVYAKQLDKNESNKKKPMHTDKFKFKDF